MKYLVVTIIAATLAACGQPPAPAAQVQLDMFSGRPPPTWTLSAADTQALRALLRELPATDATLPEDQLGYRGFIVTMPQATTMPTSTLLVRRTLIVADSNDSSRMLHDADRRIEELLIRSAKSQLDAATYAALVEQANRP